LIYLQIDARGRSCPEPILLAKKGLDKSPEGIEVIVDNVTARDNVQRFAGLHGYNAEVKQNGDDYILIIER
jgi:tRNA 2-thiouridine synthesizing protein A